MKEREKEIEETDAVAHTISVGYGWSFISSHSLTLSKGEKNSAHIHQTTINHRLLTPEALRFKIISKSKSKVI